MHRAGSWLLLADAARARVVRFPKHAGGPEHAPLETVFERNAEHRPLRDIMADAPGRSFASTGAHRSAMEYHSDPVLEETRNFAIALLNDLEARLDAGEFERLVICAPPRMLGLLREVMPRRLAAVVHSEVAKDYTRLPVLDLRALMERMAAPPQ